MKRTNRGLVGRLLGGSFGNSGCCHVDLLFDAHETRRVTSDLSDEGIDDTFVSVHRDRWTSGMTHIGRDPCRREGAHAADVISPSATKHCLTRELRAQRSEARPNFF